LPRIGVDLGGTKIEGVVLGDDGVFGQRRRVETPSGDYAGTLSAIADLVRDLERAAGRPCKIGVGTPGAASPTSGLLRNANSVCLNDRPFSTDLSERLQRDIRVANDADCFALSEAVDGAAAGAHNVFGVIIGTGTGAGIVVDGRLLTGPNAIAGEWGHNPLPWPTDDERPGPACYCGKHGCIETWLSGPGLARDFDATGATRPVDIVALAERGDHAARQCLERYEDRLARSLAGVINLLDPDVIVLGGGLSQIARLYGRVAQRLSDYVFSDTLLTRLVPPLHGDSSGVRGAARLWPA
jgi:fructokinase